MRSFISEDDIEQAILGKLSAEPFCYDIVRCDASPEKRDVLPDGTGRANKKQWVLPEELKESLLRINPTIPEDKIDSVIKKSDNVKPPCTFTYQQAILHACVRNSRRYQREPNVRILMSGSDVKEQPFA